MGRYLCWGRSSSLSSTTSSLPQGEKGGAFGLLYFTVLCSDIVIHLAIVPIGPRDWVSLGSVLLVIYSVHCSRTTETGRWDQSSQVLAACTFDVLPYILRLFWTLAKQQPLKMNSSSLTCSVRLTVRFSSPLLTSSWVRSSGTLFSSVSFSRRTQFNMSFIMKRSALHQPASWPSSVSLPCVTRIKSGKPLLCKKMGDFLFLFMNLRTI